MTEFDLVSLLKEKDLHICCAESCTGGLLAATIVNVPSASSVLGESYVTYCDDAKTHCLGVSPATITLHGVVSEAVAAAMAMGAARVSGAEVGVGITGYAGPEGGDEHAGVGTVCFGFDICGKVHTVTLYRPEMGRNLFRAMCVQFAIDELYRLLAEE